MCDAALSVVGGVIAGIIVILIQSAWAWAQRRRAAKEVGAFFRTWETDVGRQGDDAWRLVVHKKHLRTVHILLDRWSKVLSAEQSKEIAEHIAQHEHSLFDLEGVGVNPDAKLQKIATDQFFRAARRIKWLSF